ncbi:SusC/RagA family TonB-linked outer membrane protein [Chitinophaga sp. LS1]|uniref:SusC/RagA family TonB-linked outer membrane protein n=1 Tax=Chitinophaga sp. LS1 TaxID=3051176 RepID=UPI002AAC2F76|nr:SusC/RagA family TonB-linked outer membrane protein [Chitinophaga sp. LS1]WPV65766.1 SusC/RagA family TonB-linked outer membrane protein [Chitinophaga sp. LS1]
MQFVAYYEALREPGPWTKIFRTMRFIAYLLFVCCLHVSAKSVSQSITFTGRNVPMKTVLDAIEKQTGYVCFSNGSVLANAKPVNVDAKHLDLSVFLDLVLHDQPLEYTIESKTIIIRKKTPLPYALPVMDAQPLTIKVTGIITDDKGVALPGVSVRVKNSKDGTVTDAHGLYSLENVDENALLVFTFIGYTTQEIPVRGKRIISISLTPALNKLDETVVQAYGATSKRYNTGNIDKVSAEELMLQPVENPLAALEGRVPGMIVTQSSGIPGSTFKVEIRGRMAFDKNLSDDQPLFIVDGVPMAANNGKINKLTSAAGVLLNSGISPFNSINMNDIASIEVLKDADATAIYGSRGANGVILITTKRGKPGKTRLDVGLSHGISKVTRTVPMMNTQEYLQMRREAFTNSNTAMTNANAYDLLAYDTTRYTDLTKLFIGNTATTTDAQASIAGGTVNTQYILGTGYHYQTTVYPGDSHEQRGSMHIGITSRSDDKRFNLNFSGGYSVDQNNIPATDISSVMQLPPNFQIYDSLGNYAWNEGGITAKDNPLALYLNQNYRINTSNLQGNLLLGYRILPNLELRTSLGYNSTIADEQKKLPRAAQNPSKGSATGSLQLGNNQFKSWIVEPQIEYNTHISKGKLTLLGGATFNAIRNNSLMIIATGYTSDELLGSLAAAGTNSISTTNSNNDYRYQAFFARANYNYDNKYLINFTGRRDGSSRFGPQYRFSNFGSLAGAWLFTNEQFLSKQQVLSYGKIRASYGLTGNDKIGDYKYLDSWKATSYNYTDSASLYPTILYNPNLHWEKNIKTEVAMELGFLKDKLLTTVALYRNISSDPLVGYPLPYATGFSSITANLNGVLIENRGIEISINTTNVQTKTFSWNSYLNVTIPQNRLVKYPNLATSTYANQYKLGESLNLIYGSVYTGLDSNGLYSIKDVNKDGLGNASDYGVHGKTDQRLYGGLSNTFSYKGFQLDFLFQFVKQTGMNFRSNGLYNPPGTMYNQPKLLLDRWQKPGDQSANQKYTLSAGSITGTSGYYAMMFSDYRYGDASYIRLKNVSLAYTIPQEVLKRLRILSCRVYVQAQNLLTITGYQGGDPETQNYLYMPPLRTIVGGIQLNL